MLFPLLLPTPFHHQLPQEELWFATPDSFDGTLSSTEVFINQLLLYFNNRKLEMKDDSDKITFALSYGVKLESGPDWVAATARRTASRHLPLKTFLETMDQHF